VRAGDPLLELRTDDGSRFAPARAAAAEAIEITATAPAPVPLLLDRIA
jgi:thymidine phosphorylase